MSPVISPKVKPSRGRPKSEEKREQIFEAAIGLFVKDGFQQTTMADVADYAGVSKQTVYSHFASKHELYDAAIRHACEKIGTTDDFDNDRRLPKRVLEDVGGRFLRLLLSPGARALYRLVLANSRSHPEVARVFFEVGPHNFIGRLAGYLERQDELGRLCVRDPRIAAAQFFSMLRGELHMRAVLEVGPRPTKAQVDEYVRSCVALLVDAWRPND